MENTRLLAMQRHDSEQRMVFAESNLVVHQRYTDTNERHSDAKERHYHTDTHQSPQVGQMSSASGDLLCGEYQRSPASPKEERPGYPAPAASPEPRSTVTLPCETHSIRSEASNLSDLASEQQRRTFQPAANDESCVREDVLDTTTAACYADGQKAEQEQSRVHHSYWSPFWLRKSTLLALVALYASLAVALIVLWFSNKALNGFRTTLSTNHYAWTYGPTAVLTIVLAFWRQVDYYCKIIQPWNELRKGSSDADNSMLLDYLSPIQITSIIRAVRLRHANVVASLMGFATIKAVILLSTGLLVLTPVRIVEPHPVTLTKAFDTTGFWHTVANDEPGVFTGDLRFYENVSMFPVHEYIGSLAKQGTDMTGIVGNVVLPSFEPAPQDSLVGISVEADAFVVNASCEIATVTPRLSDSNQLLVRLDTPTCTVGADKLSGIIVIGATQCMTSCPDRTVVDGIVVECPEHCRRYFKDSLYTKRPKYDFFRVNCSEVEVSDHGREYLDVSTPDDLRFAMLVSNLTKLHLTNYQTFPQSNFSAPDKPLDVSLWPPMAAVICKSDYSMELFTIDRAIPLGTESVSPVRPVSNLNNFTAAMFGELIYSAIDSATTFSDSADDEVSPLFNILTQSLQGEKSMDRLLNADLLQSTARQAWTGIGAFFVRQNLLRDDIVEVMGVATHVENCLLMKAAPLWLMVAGLMLVCVFASCIAFNSPPETVPKDPGLLSTDAMVLAPSSNLQHLFRSCGAMLDGQLPNMLRGIRFSTHVDHRFCIDVVASETHETTETTKTTEDKARDWIPLPARYEIISLTMITPLVVIAVLEILWSYSAAHEGLVDVSGSEDEAAYLSRYGSAMVSLMIATCFNSLDFTTSSFAPYSILRTGGITASRGISLQLLGSLPPIALVESIRQRHVSSFCSNLASSIGSVLTIVASGLWVIDRAVVSEQPVAASISSRWNIEWLNSSQSGDGGAGALFDRYQHGSASMPTRTWNGIILPDIADIRPLPDSGSDVAFKDSHSAVNLTFQLEGLRPLLHCEAIGTEHVTTSRSMESMGKTMSGQGPPDETRLSVTAIAAFPASCSGAGTNASHGYFNFTSSRVLAGHSDYLGDFHDLHVGNWTSEDHSQDYDETEYNFVEADNPAGCPSIGVILADISTSEVPPQNATAILCSQEIQGVQLHVTYSGQQLREPTIGINKASNVVEVSAKNLINGTDNVDTFPYRVQSYLKPYTATHDSQDHGILTPFSTINIIDPTISIFIDHLMYGPNGTSGADLVGEVNQRTFIEAVSDLYARYMCFVIDMRFREPVDPGMQATTAGDESFVEGTAYGFSSRLQLNRTSKLIMQILLGVMTLLGACTYLLSDLRGTLPRKPTTIASRMALLAGSDLCDEQKALLPHDAIWMGDDDLQRLSDGWLFSLGWWQEFATDSEEADSGSDDRNQEDQAHRDDSQVESASTVANGQERKRFGIDVGVPEQLGYRETKWWGLRRRLVRRGKA